MTTQLLLDIQDTNNTKTFRIKDDSAYNNRIEIKEAFLQIIPPGFDELKQFTVKTKFDIIFNTSLLGILPAKTYTQLADLPDGLYKITYSIPPTDKAFIEYNYFRTSKIIHKYNSTLHKLYKNRGNFLLNDFNNKKKDFIWIKILIDSAKFAGEDKHDETLAIELYNDASELLDDIINIHCS